MAFKEYMIKKKKTGTDILLSILVYFLAVIVALLVFVFLMPLNMGSIALLLIAGAFYGAYILNSRRDKEFEYICTDDSIDIDVIMNKSKRKRLISFNLEQTELIADVNDAMYNSELTGQFGKTIDATSGNRDKQVYFAVVSKNGKILVKFEPTYSMLEMFSQFARSKVHIYNR